MYETQVTHAAVDAGADIVVGHHAHILRGVEIYRGKPIFHGLGNFVTVTGSFALEGNVSPERQAWGLRRKQIYGFELDPAMPAYPFHPESRNTMVAVVRIAPDGTLDPGLVPCYIDADARPVPRNRADGGEEVLAYIDDITRRAALNAAFTWRDENLVSISARSDPAG
jgi:poly-gamma-glutamate synthesis protein (capsule biosynthesis protein)